MDTLDPIALDGRCSKLEEGRAAGTCNSESGEHIVSALPFLAADRGERAVTFGCNEFEAGR